MKTFADQCLERVEKCDTKEWTFKTEGSENKGSHSVECENGLNIISYGWNEYEDYAFDNSDHIELSPQEMEFIAHARTDVPELARRLKKAIYHIRLQASSWHCNPHLIEGANLFDKIADELEKVTE